MLDYIITNGIFMTPDGPFSGNLGIKDGKIAAFLKTIPKEVTAIYNANGNTVLPGCVDMHVHINDPGRTEWEDWPHATAAAAAGGVTTVADMPLNSFPAVTDIKSLELKKQAAKNNSYVDYILWGGLTNENAEELPSMQKAGVLPFKAFMSASGIPDFSSASEEALLSGLEKTAGTPSFIGVHAECEAIASYLGNHLKKQGRTDPMAWVESRPVSCEVEAIVRFLSLASASGGNGHICHVTTAEGAVLIDQARKRGLPVTFETCASYLTFTQDDFVKRGPVLKCAPPLRTAENREKLWNLLKDDVIPIVTSDHSPCTRELKERGNQNIWEAWGGISGIQTTLYTMLTEGYHKRNLPLEKLIKVCAENPARRLGLENQKGSIAPGYDADLVVVDLDKEWILTSDDLYTKNKLSPLIGSPLKGKVMCTFLRGEIIFQDGFLSGSPKGKLAIKN